MFEEPFLTKIEKFLTDHGVAATTFGKDAVGDPRFVFDLREGRSPSLRVALRVINFMDEHGSSAPRVHAHEGDAA